MEGPYPECEGSCWECWESRLCTLYIVQANLAKHTLELLFFVTVSSLLSHAKQAECCSGCDNGGQFYWLYKAWDSGMKILKNLKVPFFLSCKEVRIFGRTFYET